MLVKRLYEESLSDVWGQWSRKTTPYSFVKTRQIIDSAVATYVHMHIAWLCPSARLWNAIGAAVPEQEEDTWRRMKKGGWINNEFRGKKKRRKKEHSSNCREEQSADPEPVAGAVCRGDNKPGNESKWMVCRRVCSKKKSLCYWSGLVLKAKVQPVTGHALHYPRPRLSGQGGTRRQRLSVWGFKCWGEESGSWMSFKTFKPLNTSSN